LTFSAEKCYIAVAKVVKVLLVIERSRNVHFDYAQWPSSPWRLLYFQGLLPIWFTNPFNELWDAIQSGLILPLGEVLPYKILVFLRMKPPSLWGGHPARP